MKKTLNFDTLNDVVKKCKFCDWSTKDINNLSGAYKSHLIKIHGVNIDKYLKQYPEELEYFQRERKKSEIASDPNNYVICAVCGDKFEKITSGHLNKHGLTNKEYIEKYGNNIISNNTHSKFFCNSKQINLSTYKLPKKYVATDEYTFKAVCKRTKFEINDFNNNHGKLSFFLQKNFNIETPNLHSRKKYYIENDMFWHEQYFDIIKVPIGYFKKKKIC